MTVATSSQSVAAVALWEVGAVVLLKLTYTLQSLSQLEETTKFIAHSVENAQV
jgi:hypothetical protein